MQFPSSFRYQTEFGNEGGNRKPIHRLVLAFSLTCAPATWAAPTVLSVQHDLSASASACNGTAGYQENGPHTDSSGFRSARSVSASATTSFWPYTEASSTASGLSGFGGLGLQFFGYVSTHQAGIYPLTIAHAFHDITFETTGQVETVTIDLQGLSMLNNDGTHLSGFQFLVLDAARTQTFVSGSHYSTPQTIQFNHGPRDYFLQAGMEVFDNTYDRSQWILRRPY